MPPGLPLQRLVAQWPNVHGRGFGPGPSTGPMAASPTLEGEPTDRGCTVGSTESKLVEIPSVHMAGAAVRALAVSLIAPTSS